MINNDRPNDDRQHGQRSQQRSTGDKQPSYLPTRLKGNVVAAVDNFGQSRKMTTLPKKAGRPRKIKTPEEFHRLAQDYFDWCDNWIDKVTGRVGRNYMITGLALHLGLSSRQELYDYCGYEGFEEIAAAARLKVEGDYERRLDSAKFVGAIFALKNMGWRDERHVEMKSADGMLPNINVTLDVSKLSTDVLAQVWGALIVTDRESSTR